MDRNFVRFGYFLKQPNISSLKRKPDAMRRRWIAHTASAILGFVFLYTAQSKLFNYNRYVHQMEIQPLPLWLTSILPWLLPTIEIVICMLLIIGIFNAVIQKYALLTSIVLLSAFTVYVGLVLFEVFAWTPCSCGGVLDSLTWGQHMIFNLSLIALGLLGLYALRKRAFKSMVNTPIAAS